MMRNDRVLIVRSSEGDWEALYVDGVKITENHSLSAMDIMCALGIKIEYFDHPGVYDMTRNDRVLIVRSGEGDWETLYVDGVKIIENHSLSAMDIMCALGIKIEYFDHPELEDPDQCDPKKMFPNVWDK